MDELDPNLVKAIEKAVETVFEKERSEFWISQPQHFLHHQWISSVMAGACEAQKWSLRIVVSSTIIFILGGIVLAIKELIK